ncbi:MAG: hypothetical protein ACREOH_22565, partial [Candidatus Entotheonellia bacterium]
MLSVQILGFFDSLNNGLQADGGTAAVSCSGAQAQVSGSAAPAAEPWALAATRGRFHELFPPVMGGNHLCHQVNLPA